jgi:hypothetical protein
MRALLLLVPTLLATFNAKADIITVRVSSVMSFNHKVGIPTKQAIDSSAVNYLNYIDGNNTLTFDLDKKILTINDKSPCKIFEIKDTDDLLDCIVLDNGVKVHYALGELVTGEMSFSSSWEWKGLINGYYAPPKNFTFTVENEFRHLIDYSHFDNKLLERLVFKELNNYRDSLGVIDLLWSDEMYKYISCKQTEILAKGSGLYHPDLQIKFTDEFRVALAKESERLTGMKSYSNCSPKAVLSLSENAFSTDLYHCTYESLAKSAIIEWDKSILHKCNQKHHYLVNGGGKGFVSISVRLNNQGSKLFILCNFSNVHKESEATSH